MTSSAVRRSSRNWKARAWAAGRVVALDVERVAGRVQAAGVGGLDVLRGQDALVAGVAHGARDDERPVPEIAFVPAPRYSSIASASGRRAR